MPKIKRKSKAPSPRSTNPTPSNSPQEAQSPPRRASNPKSDVPLIQKQLESLGVILGDSEGEQEAKADCPFCGRESKLAVNLGKETYRCFVCEESGNIYTFFRQLFDMAKTNTTEEDYDELVTMRDLGRLSSITGKSGEDIFRPFDVVKNPLNGQWIHPGYSPEGKLMTIYRLVNLKQKNGDYKYKWLLVKGTKHRVIVANTQQDKPNNKTAVVEGLWDAAVLNAVTSRFPEDSTIRNSKVVCAPGINSLSDDQLELFEGEVVTLLFDNDFPRVHPKTGAEIPPAGWSASRNTVIKINLSGTPAEDYFYVSWGEEGFDPELANGTDISDVILNGLNGLKRLKANCQEIEDRIQQPPEDWYQVTREEFNKEKLLIPEIACTSYKDLITTWQKAMFWSDGLDQALSTMLASIASTQVKHDQLWVKVIGPPSCGKSRLCEAVSVNRKYVIPKSTIRGFHSGFVATGPLAGKDLSLAAKARDKTLVTKDGDTLMQSPNFGEIMAQARDIYDRCSRADYRNGTGKDYEEQSMTWILAGTSSLRGLDNSELGERFLDCVIMDEIDLNSEKLIQANVITTMEATLGDTPDGTASGNQTDEMIKAMGKTGGYITHLRHNVHREVNRVKVTSEAATVVTELARFVAFMRCRPSKAQNEEVQRELAARLTAQLYKYLKITGVVLQEWQVGTDSESLRRTYHRALDTSRGITQEIVKYVYSKEEGGGVTSRSVAIRVNTNTQEAAKWLRFLKAIKVIRVKDRKYKLRPSFRELYEQVIVDSSYD